MNKKRSPSYSQHISSEKVAPIVNAIFWYISLGSADPDAHLNMSLDNCASFHYQLIGGCQILCQTIHDNNNTTWQQLCSFSYSNINPRFNYDFWHRQQKEPVLQAGSVLPIQDPLNGYGSPSTPPPKSRPIKWGFARSLTWSCKKDSGMQVWLK